jgi:hypothetical protein
MTISAEEPPAYQSTGPYGQPYLGIQNMYPPPPYYSQPQVTYINQEQQQEQTER